MDLKWMIALGLLCMIFLAGCPEDSGNPNEGRSTLPVGDGDNSTDDSSSSGE